MNYKFLGIIILSLFITVTAGAYAVSSSSFSDKASLWASRACNNIESSVMGAGTNINHAVCHNYYQSQENSDEIDELRNLSTESSGYVLKEWNTRLQQNHGTEKTQLSRAMAPADGVISVLSVVGKYEDQELYSSDGSIEFEVLVNGENTGFIANISGTDLDAINDEGGIQVNKGDVISVKVKTKDLAPPSDGFERPNLDYSLVLYMQ